MAYESKLILRDPPVNGHSDDARSPPQLSWEIFVNEVIVKRTQFFHIGALVTFGVEVVRIKSADPFEHLTIPIVHQISVLAIAMGRIERVIPNHVKRLGWQVIFHHLIK